MDAQKAKYILSGGQPRETDADQEGFQEALELAAQNPELREWMRQQQKVTDALHAKLNEIPVPTGLKDRILAGEAVSRRRSRFSRRTILSMAAAFVALLSILVWQFFPGSPSGEKTYAGLRYDMAQFLTDYFSLEVQSRFLDKLQTYLADEHQFTTYTVPEYLAEQTSIGCRMIDWQGSRVALICFTVNRELVHLLVLPKDQLRELPGNIQIKREGVWTTIGWLDDDNVYLVATRGNETFLKDMVAGKFSS